VPAQRGGSGRPDRSGIGGLVGSGPSAVGVSGSMRARDVSRPRPEDEAAAAEELVVRTRPFVPNERPARPGPHPAPPAHPVDEDSSPES
jgi:hypothetical protein